MKYIYVNIFAGITLPPNLKSKILPKKYIKSGPSIFGKTTPGRMAMKGLRNGIKTLDKSFKNTKEYHDQRVKLYEIYLNKCKKYLEICVMIDNDIQNGNLPTASFNKESGTLSFKQTGGQYNVASLNKLAQDDNTILVKINTNLVFNNTSKDPNDLAAPNDNPSVIALYNKKTKVLALQCGNGDVKWDKKYGNKPPGFGHPDPVFIKLDEESEHEVISSEQSHIDALVMNDIIQFVANSSQTRNVDNLVSSKEKIPDKYRKVNDDLVMYRGMSLGDKNHGKFNNKGYFKLKNKKVSSWADNFSDAYNFVKSKGGLMTKVPAKHIKKLRGILVNLTHDDFRGIRWQKEIIVDGPGPIKLTKKITDFIKSEKSQETSQSVQKSDRQQRIEELRTKSPKIQQLIREQEETLKHRKIIKERNRKQEIRRQRKQKGGENK